MEKFFLFFEQPSLERFNPEASCTSLKRFASRNEEEEEEEVSRKLFPDTISPPRAGERKIPHLPLIYPLIALLTLNSVIDSDKGPIEQRVIRNLIYRDRGRRRMVHVTRSSREFERAIFFEESCIFFPLSFERRRRNFSPREK